MAEPLPGECGAAPHEGNAHNGPARPYVRICPHGHLRAGYACDSCHGPMGAVLCGDCEGDKPAILIGAGTFARMIADHRRAW